MISIADETIKIGKKARCMTPQTPHLVNHFLGGTPSFFNQFHLKRCQNVQEIILHQIQGSPKEFETSPFLGTDRYLRQGGNGLFQFFLSIFFGIPP